MKRRINKIDIKKSNILFIFKFIIVLLIGKRLGSLMSWSLFFLDVLNDIMATFVVMITFLGDWTVR
jgi:hypothetical protein